MNSSMSTFEKKIVTFKNKFKITLKIDFYIYEKFKCMPIVKWLYFNN